MEEMHVATYGESLCALSRRDTFLRSPRAPDLHVPSEPVLFGVFMAVSLPR